MEWVLLLTAGIAEVVWAVSMKFADGFTKPLPSAVTAVFYIASAVFLSMALKKLPLGTAYAMWTGFGIVGTTLLGVAFFHESLTAAQIVCIVMIAAGITGLKVF